MAAFFISIMGLIIVGKGIYTYTAPILPNHPMLIYIKKGITHRAFVTLLKDRDLINDTFSARCIMWILGINLKQGEYELPARGSLRNILMLVEKNKSYQRVVTFPEGVTSVQICAILEKATGLAGACPAELLEGSIIANTYAYHRGESKIELISRWQKETKNKLLQLWAKRRPDTPLKTPEEMAILASIVEKETSKLEERPLVAAVFLNRLKKKMPLQADPTVLYGLNKKKPRGGALQQNLSKKDLKTSIEENPYNTYKIRGLPPTAIAHPGIAALESVIMPAQEKYLYFVADGTGGHVFSTTLVSHQENHKKWRKRRKNYKKSENL